MTRSRPALGRPARRAVPLRRVARLRHAARASRPLPVMRQAEEKVTAGDDALVGKVRKAIDEGISFLRGQQRKDNGSWEVGTIAGPGGRADGPRAAGAPQRRRQAGRPGHRARPDVPAQAEADQELRRQPPDDGLLPGARPAGPQDDPGQRQVAARQASARRLGLPGAGQGGQLEHAILPARAARGDPGRVRGRSQGARRRSRSSSSSRRSAAAGATAGRRGTPR